MKQPKPTTGKLEYEYPSGKKVVLYSGLPFGMLQQKKSEAARMGYRRDKLRITY